MKIILVMILLGTVFLFAGCDMYADYQTKKEVLPLAEDAVAAHKKFIDGVGNQTGLTFASFMTTTLDPDYKFRTYDTNKLNGDLKELQRQIKAAHEEWEQVQSALGDKIKGDSSASDRMANHAKEARSYVDAAEKLLKQIKT